MLGALIIVFREVLEAGLIVGIVLAATQGISRARGYIWGGLLAGVIGSCIVAAFTGVIAESFSGYGQEIFNASVLGIAVLMLAWHNIWMASHGRAMAHELKQTGRDVSEGRKPLMAMAIVVGAAVLREGSEVALFLYGVLVSNQGSTSAIIAGGLAGLAAGAAVSALTYAGLLRVPMRHFFTVTTWLVTFLAAGMAAQAVSFLERAGLVETLSATAWDTSEWLSESSVPGRILHTLVGYSDQPTQLQLVVYLLVLCGIILFTKLSTPAPAQHRAKPAE